MDMSYATIPLFGEHKKLYRENKPAYVVSIQDKPENHPIYAIDIDLGSSIFYNDFNFEEEQPVWDKQKENECFSKKQEAFGQEHRGKGEWSMYFDGSISKEGVGVGVWIISPDGEFVVYSFKLMYK